MTIIFCGPPHSGKSLFLSKLKRLLPDDCQRVIHIGSVNEVKNACQLISQNQDAKILLVDFDR